MTPAPVLIPADLAGELKAMDTGQLKAELRELVGSVTGQILRMAGIYQELSSRGADLSDLRGGLFNYLPLVTGGQARVGLVAKFLGRPAALRELVSLPGLVQDQIVAERPFPVVVPSGDALTERQLPIHVLTVAQIRVVVGEMAIRTPTEQAAILARLRKAPPKVARVGKIRIDRAAGEIRAGKMRLDPGDLLRALAELRTTPDEGEVSEVVTVRLTPAQHTRLRVRAAKGGTTMTQLILNAMGATGLLADET